MRIKALHGCPGSKRNAGCCRGKDGRSHVVQSVGLSCFLALFLSFSFFFSLFFSLFLSLALSRSLSLSLCCCEREPVDGMVKKSPCISVGAFGGVSLAIRHRIPTPRNNSAYTSSSRTLWEFLTAFHFQGTSILCRGISLDIRLATGVGAPQMGPGGQEWVLGGRGLSFDSPL